MRECVYFPFQRDKITKFCANNFRLILHFTRKLQTEFAKCAQISNFNCDWRAQKQYPIFTLNAEILAKHWRCRYHSARNLKRCKFSLVPNEIWKHNKISERQNRQQKKDRTDRGGKTNIQRKKDRARKSLTNNCLFCGKFKRKSQCIHKQFPHQYNLDDLSTNYLLFKIRQKIFKRPIVGIDINRPRTLPSNAEWN